MIERFVKAVRKIFPNMEIKYKKVFNNILIYYSLEYKENELFCDMQEEFIKKYESSHSEMITFVTKGSLNEI